MVDAQPVHHYCLGAGAELGSAIGTWPNLLSFRTTSSGFVGKLPWDRLAVASKVLRVDFSGCKYSGSIPAEVMEIIDDLLDRMLD